MRAVITALIVAISPAAPAQTVDRFAPKLAIDKHGRIKGAVTKVDMTEDQRKLVMARVLSKLRDPESARFGAMHAARDGDEDGFAVCGVVNARNGFGGYTGDQPFMGVLFDRRDGGKPPIFVPLAIGGRKIDRDATILTCARDYKINLF